MRKSQEFELLEINIEIIEECAQEVALMNIAKDMLIVIMASTAILLEDAFHPKRKEKLVSSMKSVKEDMVVLENA